MKKYLLLVLVAVTAILAFAETERVLQLFKDDTVISQYSLEDVDYLEIKDVMAPPATVTAVLDGDNVIVNWSPVEGAETYSVYRSSEPDAGYVVVAQNLSASTWTDLSPMNGANYYKVGAFAEGQVSLSSSSSACVIYSAVEIESGLYLGITAYNKDLYKCPMQILNEESRSSFNSFIDVLTKDNGTLLYYAEDQALKTLENTAFPKDLTNIALVTFTDGIDIGSGKYAPEYGSNDAFLNSLSERITNDTISDVKLSAYTIGLAGKDVDTPEAKLMFSNILKKLASSEENSYEVANMDEVNAKFQEIAQSLSETSYVQKLTLALPWAYPGTRFRVTFDNVTSATASNLYIEGVYAEKEPSDVGDVIRLKDLVFAGMATSSSSVALGAVQSDNDLYYTFKFDDVVTDSRIPLTISDETTFQYFYEENVNYWYKNSEYVSSQGTNTVTEKRSAAVMLVLDSSSSLGDDHEILKSHAKSFISTLLEAQGVEPEDPSEPDTPTEPETPSYNGHEYVDLGLPSGLKWATCNIGASTPTGYGNYYAWGETTTKADYSDVTSTTYGKSISELKSSGIIDSDGNLTAQYDAASVNWGGSWRLPTLIEVQELINNCTWTWTTESGTNGHRVKGPNGNSIFLPAAGYRFGTSLGNAGYYGYFWSSSPDVLSSHGAYYLIFDSGYGDWGSGGWRYNGFSVRPVSE